MRSYRGCLPLRRAFTLVELLVVVAVIAILAALLLPALSRAKVAAENTVCRSNLKQQALGLSGYLGDFHAYPLAVGPPQEGPGNVLWMEALERYVGDRWSPDTARYDGTHLTGLQPRGVYSCPGYNRVRGLYWIYKPGATGAYGYNAIEALQLISTGGEVRILSLGEWGGSQPVKESQVVAPSQMIAIGDSQIPQAVNQPGDDITGIFVAPWSQSALIAADIALPPGATLPPVTIAALQRHGGRWNMAFCDGHVGHGRGRMFFDWRNDEVLKLWNRDNQVHRQ